MIHSVKEQPKAGVWILVVHPSPVQPYSLQRFTGDSYLRYTAKEHITGWYYITELLKMNQS